MRSRNIRILACVAFLIAGLAACNQGGGQGQGDAATDRQQTGQTAQAPSPGMPGAASGGAERHATAVIEPTQAGNVRGTIEFHEQEDGVLITARLEGLTEGEHGFHVHEFGDCSAPDASSAGEHYAPGEPHGAPEAQQGQRHTGDLGNIKAGPDGTATYERVDPLIQLDGAQSIVGKAIVIHAKADDLQTQPSGNSGERVGCGVVALGQGSDPTGGTGG